MVSCNESIGQPFDNFFPNCHKNIKWLHGALLPQCFSLNTQNEIKKISSK
jgi:hypothetical protein